jgi:E3 ubiquitin-protein ligase HUWE1
LDALVKDPESFICKLHAQVLEVVLPIWNHPGFMHCDVTLINSIASIITHIYIGVGNVNGSRMPGFGGVGLRLIGQPLEESSISVIVEMGFSQVKAEEALSQVDNNSVEMAMEWLFSHPEEIL